MKINNAFYSVGSLNNHALDVLIFSKDSNYKIQLLKPNTRLCWFCGKLVSQHQNQSKFFMFKMNTLQSAKFLVGAT